MDKTEKLNEALYRMLTLKLAPKAIEEVKAGNHIVYWNGGLYHASPKIEKYIVDFERETDSLVYYCMYDITNFGKMFTVLYVSDDEEEWEMDRKELKQGCPLAYVENTTYPECSEYGSIRIKCKNGLLERTE